METSEKIFSRNTNILLQRHHISDIFGSLLSTMEAFICPKTIKILHIQGLLYTLVVCNYRTQSSVLSFFKRNIKNSLKGHLLYGFKQTKFVFSKNVSLRMSMPPVFNRFPFIKNSMHKQCLNLFGNLEMVVRESRETWNTEVNTKNQGDDFEKHEVNTLGTLRILKYYNQVTNVLLCWLSCRLFGSMFVSTPMCQTDEFKLSRSNGMYLLSCSFL